VVWLQVRKVICEWLAWLLRMSRPGRSLSRRYLQRKARMRELTAKSPPSMSLMSNVKDVDNAIPLNNYRSDIVITVSAVFVILLLLVGQWSENRCSCSFGSRVLSFKRPLLSLRVDVCGYVAYVCMSGVKVKNYSATPDC